MINYNCKKGASVIICCYNSAKRLPITLEHLANQKASDISWEVILVDNASTDDTILVAQKIWDNHKNSIPFKIISEQRQGLSYARERGIDNAQYEYIIFCDDDNWLAEDYVQRSFNIMWSDAQIGVAGGICNAVFETTAPEWFDKHKGCYAVGKQSDVTGDITYTRGYLWGAGMILRKSVWLKVKEMGFQSILSDRKGKIISSGGDTEICLVFRQAGYKLYYDEYLSLQHFVPASRLTWPYLVKLYKSHARSIPYFQMYWYIGRYIDGQYVIRRSVWWRDQVKTVLIRFGEIASKNEVPTKKHNLNSSSEYDFTIECASLFSSLIELLSLTFKYQKHLSSIDTMFKNIKKNEQKPVQNVSNIR